MTELSRHVACADVGPELSVGARKMQDAPIDAQLVLGSQHKVEPWPEGSDSSILIPSYNAVSPDARRTALLRSSYADVQADQPSRSPLLQSSTSTVRLPSDVTAVQEHGSPTSAIVDFDDILQPQVTSSWASLLDPMSQPHPSFQQHYGNDSSPARSTVKIAVQSPTETLSSVESELQGVTLLDQERALSPPCRRQAGARQAIANAAVRQAPASPVERLQNRPVTIQDEGPREHYGKDLASALGPSSTQFSRPKMPGLSPASQARLASLQASTAGSPKPQSLLQRARIQQDAATVVDRLMAAPRKQSVLLDAARTPHPSASALAALTQDFTPVESAVNKVVQHTAKLHSMLSSLGDRDSTGLSPLLQDRFVPEFLKEPAAVRQRRSGDWSGREAWHAPTTRVNPRADDTFSGHPAYQGNREVNRKGPGQINVPQDQWSGGSASSSQQLSAMDLIKQMVHRDSKPSPPQHSRYVCRHCLYLYHGVLQCISSGRVHLQLSE